VDPSADPRLGDCGGPDRRDVRSGAGQRVEVPRLDDESARGWLYGIARNLVRRYHRRGRVELAMCAKLGIRLELDSDELADLDGQLDDSLPDTQREALQLRVVDGLDYREAAAQMGTSEQNVRIRVSRALRALSTRLQGASR
jgi:RNA polymerase sigma factor (sigma-70 family)